MKMKDNPLRNAILVSTTRSEGEAHKSWKVSKESRPKIKYVVGDNRGVRTAYSVERFFPIQSLRPSGNYEERIEFELTLLSGSLNDGVLQSSRRCAPQSGPVYFIVSADTAPDTGYQAPIDIAYAPVVEPEVVKPDEELTVEQESFRDLHHRFLTEGTNLTGHKYTRAKDMKNHFYEKFNIPAHHFYAVHEGRIMWAHSINDVSIEDEKDKIEIARKTMNLLLRKFKTL